MKYRHIFDIGIWIFHSDNGDGTANFYEDIRSLFLKESVNQYYILPEYRLIKFNKLDMKTIE